jgi:hypothetical protein
MTRWPIVTFDRLRRTVRVRGRPPGGRRSSLLIDIDSKSGITLLLSTDSRAMSSITYKPLHRSRPNLEWLCITASREQW